LLGPCDDLGLFTGATEADECAGCLANDRQGRAVSDRTGIGPVELAVLEEVSAAAGGRPRAHAVCTKAVTGIEERIGLGPRYGYDVLLDLARPWIIPLPTISVEGNKGDRTFPQASEPQHTACRPSQVGQVVLDAEAHRMASVPVGIINGTTYRGGVQPPLEPLRVLAALRRLLADPRAGAGEVLSIVGEPYSAAGCELTGDLDALMQGRRVVIRETGKITMTAVSVPPSPAELPGPVRGPFRSSAGLGLRAPSHPAHLVIESLPARTSGPQAVQSIASRLRMHSGPDGHPLDQNLERPIENLTDLASVRHDVRIALALRPGVDPVGVREQLAALDDISIEAAWQFPAPVANMLRYWADRHRAEDITASLASLEGAIGRDRRRMQGHG
jgi:hypothetical protein